MSTLRLWERGLHCCAVAAVLCLAGACSTMEAGTGSGPMQAAERRNGDGLGGTGVSHGAPNGVVVADTGKKNGDGIGGTGILGTISGFGSVIVNGAAWEFDRHTAVESDGKPSSLEALKVGQVIQGVARRRGDKYFLDTLEIQHAVTGPIGAVDHAGETMTVLGQTVKLNLAGDKDAIAAFRTLQAGDMVRVSGLRRDDGTVIASRVDEQPSDDGRILVRGLARVNGANVRIGALTVALSADTIVSQPMDGSPVFVSGRMINGQFVADIVSGEAALPFGGDVNDVSLEAYVPMSANPLSIQGIAVEGGALPAGTGAGDRIVVTGHIAGNNTIAATAITKVRTVVTINKANGSLRPAALRPEVHERPDRVAPPERPIERPPIDRPQAFDAAKPDVPKPTVPERPQIERPQDVIPTS